MTEIERLEVEARIAGAELGVVEEVRWIVAFLVALYLEAAVFHAWLIPVAIGVAAFFAMPYWHGRRYDAMWDAVEKATGTGKHYSPPPRSPGD